MKISVNMPVDVFERLRANCESWRGEREILNNAVIQGAEDRKSAEFICGLEQAKLLAEIATRLCPDAVPYLEDCISLASD